MTLERTKERIELIRKLDKTRSCMEQLISELNKEQNKEDEKEIEELYKMKEK